MISFAGKPRLSQKRVRTRHGALTAEVFMASSLCWLFLVEVARCTEFRVSIAGDH
jgi:hypothetical protein